MEDCVEVDGALDILQRRRAGSHGRMKREVNAEQNKQYAWHREARLNYRVNDVIEIHI